MKGESQEVEIKKGKTKSIEKAKYSGKIIM